MPSPFPGMNPWLEAPELWPGVHSAFISEIRVYLNARMPSKYFADVEERVFLCDSDDPMIRLIVPDVNVRETAISTNFGTETSTAATLTPPLLARMADPVVRERRLVIRSADEQTIVTVIEILSPANKTSGSAGRSSYLAKRRDVLESESHFIEIDLIRSGKQLEPGQGLRRSDYLIWLSRSQDRSIFEYWPTPLKSPLPTIPVPLLPGDSEVALNLQAVLNDVYDHSGYVRRINYSQPVPEPLLGEARMTWLNQFMKPPAV